MGGSKAVTISFDTTVSLENRGGHWAARIDPFCMTVYADTAEAARRRAQDAVNFLLKNTPDIRQYLESHNVPHTVDYTTDDAEPGKVWLTYSMPVKALVESTVNA